MVKKNVIELNKGKELISKERVKCSEGEEAREGEGHEHPL